MSPKSQNPIIPGCSLHHVAIQTHDWDASLSLYRDVLGMPVVLQIESAVRTIVQLDAGDGRLIELFSPADNIAAAEPSAAAPIVHLALGTTDARAAAEHVRAAGYKITDGPRDVDVGDLRATVAFFCGPNGEIIEFFQSC